MDLDLRTVRAFVAAADQGHVGRAAKGLFLTQQALSKRLARLEEQTGVLFDRGPTGVSLTPNGRRFLPAARHLLEVADEALATARGTRAPVLRVDVWGKLAPVEPMLRRFTAEQPEAMLEVSMRQNLAAALQALRRNEIDVAIGNVATSPPRCQPGSPRPSSPAPRSPASSTKAATSPAPTCLTPNCYAATC